MLKEELIEQLKIKYFEDTRKYYRTVVLLVSLKHILRTYSEEHKFKTMVIIEPKLTYITKNTIRYPDLLVIDLNSMRSVALDHKYIESLTSSTIKNELMDIINYLGKAKCYEAQNKMVDINLCGLIIPDNLFNYRKKIIYNTILQEKMNILIISYNLDLENNEIALTFYNPRNIPIDNVIIRKFFERTKRVFSLPREAFMYKFIKKERIPNFYLIREVYNIILANALSDPLSDEAVAEYDTIIKTIRVYFPQWIYKDLKYEQFPKSLVDRAIRLMRKIGVITDIKGKRIKIKQPKNKSIDEFLAEKLAKYDIKHNTILIRKIREEINKDKKQLTLDDFAKSNEDVI